MSDVLGYAPAVAVGMTERAKYERMWEHAEYRQVAPGEGVAQIFLQQARPKPGSEVIDFGAGTGRGALVLALMGQMRVHMLDFAANCLDPEVAQALDTQRHALTFRQQDLSKPIPITAQYGFCFPAGTPVIGSGKTIENIRVGDTVLNDEGQAQKVLKTFRRIFSGAMVSIDVDCLPAVEMTDEHPIRVASVRRIHRRSTYGGTKSSYEWVAEGEQWKAAKDVVPGDWIQIQHSVVTATPTIRYNRFSDHREVAVDNDIAWLLGLYVAEGNIGSSPPGRITLSLNANERTLAERAIRAFAILGIPARICQPPSAKAGNTLRVVGDSVSLGEVFREWCGKDCYNKRIPPCIADADPGLLESFIEGLVEGDGCLRIDKRNGTANYSISTVSKVLASDVVAALLKLGRHCAWSVSSLRTESVINGRTVSNAPAHCVSWSARSTSRLPDKSGRVPYGRMRFIGGKAYSRVLDVRKQLVAGVPVYNLHTEDETYGVPFTVHNCTDVMEHIPPAQVDTVLINVLKAAQHVFFQIDCAEDVCGKLIGHPLHLTIEPHSWWLKKFIDLGCYVHWSQDNQRNCLFYVTAWQTGEEIVKVGVLNTAEEQVIENVRKNVAGDWAQVTPHLRNEDEVMILAGGPSLAKFEDQIRQMRAAGTKLVTLNGAYNWAIERGIAPISAQIIVDAREFNARFTKPVINQCKYLIASQCHPSVLEGLPVERTLLWHTTLASIRPALSERYEEYYCIPGGSTVMLRAIPLLAMLGFHRFHLFGFDSCLLPENEASTQLSHHAYSQAENDGEVVIDTIVGDRVFKCHVWQTSQAQEFIDLVKYMGDAFELEVYGDGLIAHILKTGAESVRGTSVDMVDFA